MGWGYATALLACALQLSACGAVSGSAGGAPHAGARAPVQLQVHSNLLRPDYAGSRACQPCHAGIYASWLRSPMHNMTRRAEQAEIRAPFDGGRFTLGQDAVVFEQHDGARFMRLSNAEGTRLYRVTKEIGGRYREDYAGIDVTDAVDPARDPGRGAELVLPASYVYSTRSWRTKGYSVMVHERAALEAGPIWAGTCIGCHNTLPYLTYLYDDLYGEHAPNYQGKLSDHLLQRSRLWPATARDEPRLQRAIADEITTIGGPALSADTALHDTLDVAAHVTKRRLDGRHLIEVGIGCEACHGGAREHVADPRVRPAFGVQSPLLTLGPANQRAPSRAQQINRVCARCHTVLFTGYPWTWEGGQRGTGRLGGSTTNSGEARDLLLGHCASDLSCVACHDPHAEDSREQLDALAGLRGNALCTSCHAKYASDAERATHSHHLADGAGSACLSCHMPRKNMGLGYALTRYHRIGSPSDDARVLGDRPLECALCHADRSVEQLTGSIERFWGKHYDRDALRALYGADLSVNALDATLAHGKPHEQAVALATLGEQRVRRALPELAEQLSHPYPLVRFFAKRAIEQITAAPLPIDVGAAGSDVAAAARRWIAEQPGASQP